MHQGIAAERKFKGGGEVVPAATATLTTVNMTLVDNGGTTWANANVNVYFVPAPNVPGPYMWGNQPLNTSIIYGRTDINGHVMLGIPDNTTITPSGSMWQFVISPNATQPAVVFNLMIAGTTMDISSIFTNQSYQVQNTLIQSFPIPRSYGSGEVAIPANAGQLYYDTSNNSLMASTGLASPMWSVVYAQSPIALTSADANNLRNGSWYSWEFTNIPPALNGLLVSISVLGDIQFAMSSSDPSHSLYFRVWSDPGQWSSQWDLVATETALTALTDMNGLTHPGTYYLSLGISANGPSTVTNNTANSIVEVFAESNPLIIFQRLVCPLDTAKHNSTFHRTYNAGWGSWYEFTGTLVP